jgi:hypothetical protein
VELSLDLTAARLALHDEDGTPRWDVRLDADVLERACFREARLWAAGGVACVGAAERVWFFDLATGEPRGELRLDELRGTDSAFAQFGHFGDALVDDGTALLLVLTYTDAIALGIDLRPVWTARDLAVDGVVFGASDGRTITLGAEMDPPGGWFRVVLDARTGREIRREPDLAPGYVGPYGVGPARNGETC